MRVRANRPGFFGVWRDVGKVFDLETKEQFSGAWMEDLDNALGEQQGEATEGDVLDLSIPEIVELLPAMEKGELQVIRQREVDGKTRKTLMSAIDEELASRD